MCKKRDNVNVIVASKLKETIKAKQCMTASDLPEALSEKVHDMLNAAIKRAQANGRSTVRPCDL